MSGTPCHFMLKNRDKLEPDGPPGLSADFTIHLFILHYSLVEFRLSYTRSKEFFFFFIIVLQFRGVQQAGITSR